MSRSALWRQEGGVKERERHAEEIFQNALLEGKNRPSKGLIPIVAKDEDTFNLHPVLLKQITNTAYFMDLCEKVYDWNALVDEIYYHVTHMEPWMLQGSSAHVKTPSTAFCILLRLLTLRCTEKQMHLMLTHPDSPYIRCIGFLYLRYICDPNTLYTWFQPFLFDEEVVQVEAKPRVPSTHGRNTNTFHENIIRTVGDYVRSLLQRMDYHGTLLPRLPVSVERDIKVQLLQAEQIETRAQEHLRNAQTMEYFSKIGSKVRALYQDEENPIAWYNAVIDRIIHMDPKDESIRYARPKYVVTFLDYGNTETVTLGEMDLPSSSSLGFGSATHHEQEHKMRFSRPVENRSHPKMHDSYDTSQMRNDWNDPPNSDQRSHSHRVHGQRNDGFTHAFQHTLPLQQLPTDDDLLQEVMRRERQGVLAKGRVYVSRPASVKDSIAAASTSNVTSHSLIKDETCLNRNKRPLSPNHDERKSDAISNELKDEVTLNPPRRKTAEEIAMIEEKKRKLIARYG